MTSIAALLPEIERRLTTVKDHALYHDTGALNATEIATIKGDLMQLVIVLNILTRYLHDEARAAEIFQRAEDWINRSHHD